MELKEIEPKNLTDTIRLGPEAKLLLEPSHDIESIYETPYSIHINDNYGGSIKALRNSGNDQSTQRKWSLFYIKFWYVIIGVLIGVVIGGTVTGLLMHFTNPFPTTTVPDTIAPTARNAFYFRDL